MLILCIYENSRGLFYNRGYCHSFLYQNELSTSFISFDCILSKWASSRRSDKKMSFWKELIICSICKAIRVNYSRCHDWRGLYVCIIRCIQISLFIEDLNANTKYAVTLSYPGVYPVQYTVFLEQEEEEYSSYDYKRRIQDTRLFSFETDENGDIVKEDENGEMVADFLLNESIDTIFTHYAHPTSSCDWFESYRSFIKPLCSHYHWADFTGSNSYNTIGSKYFSPFSLIVVAILFILFIVLCCITLFYTNPSFRASIQSILCIQQKDD